MLVLGLDPSLRNYGWALHDTQAKGSSRCLARGRRQTSASTMEILRYIDLRNSVEELVRTYKPDKVSLEYPVFGEQYSSGMYGLFLFSWEALLNCRVDVVFLANGQPKALVTRYLGRPKGWGPATKQDMMEAARVDTGTGKWSGDEADAYWIAVLGGRFWEVHAGNLSESDLSRYEKRLISEIHRPKKGKFAGLEIKKGLIYRERERFFQLSQVGRDAKKEED